MSHPRQLLLPQPDGLKPELAALSLRLLLSSVSTRVICHSFLFLGRTVVDREDFRLGVR
jgi:hypothetical protein